MTTLKVAKVKYKSNKNLSLKCKIAHQIITRLRYLSANSAMMPQSLIVLIVLVVDCTTSTIELNDITALLDFFFLETNKHQSLL